MIIEIPRGAYSVTVHTREATPESIPHSDLPGIEVRGPQATPQPGQNRYKIAVALLSLCSCALLIALVFTIRSRPPAVDAISSTQIPLPLKTLWHVFMDAPDRTWVVFSNAEFVGRPETGLRYLDPAKDKNPQIFDHYTGIGEVMAVHELDQLFAQFRHGLVVKRGRLLAMDDVKNNDLIFIGSPSENLTLRDLPAMQEFQFRRLDSGARKGDLRIVNLHPAPGEATDYIASAGIPTIEDYAEIGLMPGPTRQHWVIYSCRHHYDRNAGRG